MGKIEEAVDLLKQLGLPRAQQNDRSAATLLTLLNLKEQDEWSQAGKNPIRIHDVLAFVKDNYGIDYAENTRETIRRQTIHQFEQAGLVIKNYDDPKRSTNSPKTNYIISDVALNTIHKYNTSDWENALKEFIELKGKLEELYDQRRKEHMIHVKIDGSSIDFSPGEHNDLQAQILEIFRKIFCPDTKVVYVGDTANKMLFMDKKLIEKSEIPITKHDKLPDIVLYDEEREILFLIEAVTSHGPMSPKRHIELEETLENSKAKRVYISAFLNFREFKKYASDIAWDTEIWIADNPQHMIHFNGPKFFTIYED